MRRPDMRTASSKAKRSPIPDRTPPNGPLQGDGTTPYSTIQHPDPSPFSNVKSAARVAASNTSSTPSPLRLEHSRYLRAEISRATASPSWPETKRRDFLRCSSTATGSSRRSFFRPTRMMGTFGQRRVASAIHCYVSAAVHSFVCCCFLVGVLRLAQLVSPRVEQVGQEGRRWETHLVLHVIQRIRRVNGKAYQYDVRVRVRQRPQPLIVLLACGIP